MNKITIEPFPDTDRNEVITHSKALQDAVSAYDVLRILKVVTAEYGFGFFSVIRFPTEEDTSLRGLSLLTNWPAELVHEYDEHDLLQNSPIIDALKVSMVPYSWTLFELNTYRPSDKAEAANRIFSEHGFLAGTYFPVIDGIGNRGAVSFSGTRPPCTEKEQIKLSWISSQLFQRVVHFDGNQKMRRPKLTDREIECLRWTSSGKTSIEIAAILNLSEHTINHYISTCCDKLSATNRAHAVAKGIRLGLI